MSTCTATVLDPRRGHHHEAVRCELPAGHVGHHTTSIPQPPYTPMTYQWPPTESALVSIVKVLEETYTPTGVTVWLVARNKHLDNRSPIELIDFGHSDRVLEVARAIEGVAPSQPVGGVHCRGCGRPMGFPTAGYTWTSDGIYHTFCYENQHLSQGDVQWRGR